MILKILVIIALIKLLLATDKPFLCSGIYAGFVFLIGLLFGHPIEVMLIAGVVSFALASIYFWMLSRFEGAVWWLILLVGLAVGFV